MSGESNASTSSAEFQRAGNEDLERLIPNTDNSNTKRTTQMWIICEDGPATWDTTTGTGQYLITNIFSGMATVQLSILFAAYL